MARGKLPRSCWEYVAGSPYAWMSAERALTFFVHTHLEDLKSLHVCFPVACLARSLKRSRVCGMGGAVQGGRAGCTVV